MDDQEEVIDRIVGLAAEDKVDLVVVAGDLYDRAIPPTDAVRLFDEALVRLRETGATVVAITGNHDSPNRVAVASRVLEQAGVAVRGSVARCAEPLRLDPDDGGPPVSVYPLPYLEPSLARPILDHLHGDADAGEPCEANRRDPVDVPSVGRRPPEINEPQRVGHRRVCHHDVTCHATTLIRRAAAATGPARTIVVAHTFVDGATPTDSERDLSIGNIDRVGLSVFDGFDYVALGHLHRSQAFDDGRIAYSGSPLPYSFSEENDTKSVRIVDMSAAGRCTTEIVPLGVGRPLRTLQGRLDDLLHRPEFADAAEARVRVRLTDPNLPLQAMARIQQSFPHAAMLEHVPEGRTAPHVGNVAEAVESSEQPLDLALRFWADQHRAEALPAQRDVLASALRAATREDDA